MNARRLLSGTAVLMSMMLAGFHPAQAQSVINWPTAPKSGSSSASPPLPPSIPVLDAAPAQPAESTASSTASTVPASPPIPATEPLPPLQAGYVEQAGQEPSVRLDIGHVSPELLARYAQQPGESQEAYIMRMNALYQQTQSSLEATEARNQAYLRAIAAKPPATVAERQP